MAMPLVLGFILQIGFEIEAVSNRMGPRDNLQFVAGHEQCLGSSWLGCRM